MATPAGSIPPISLRDLAVVLIKHHGLHSDRYEASVNFQFGIGGVGEGSNLSPGAVISLRGIGLAPAQHETPNAVDAAEVNPAPQSVKPAVGDECSCRHGGHAPPRGQEAGNVGLSASPLLVEARRKAAATLAILRNLHAEKAGRSQIR